MVVEIPVKKKHVAGKGIYGYSRNHNGNNKKKVKKVGNNSARVEYDKRAHALWLQPNGKLKVVHGEEARRILGD